MRGTPVLLAAAMIGGLLGLSVPGHAPSRPPVGSYAVPAPVPVSALAQRMQDREDRLERASRSRLRWVTPSKSPHRIIRSHQEGANPTDSVGTSVWDRLAECESGQRWHYNGSSGFDGGLQFLPDTWTRKKFAGYPAFAWMASREQQIRVAKKILRESGWGQWPACSRKLGLR